MIQLQLGSLKFQNTTMNHTKSLKTYNTGTSRLFPIDDIINIAKLLECKLDDATDWCSTVPGAFEYIRLKNDYRMDRVVITGNQWRGHASREQILVFIEDVQSYQLLEI